MAENMEIMDAMDIDTKEQQFDEDIENIIDLLEEKSYFKVNKTKIFLLIYRTWLLNKIFAYRITWQITRLIRTLLKHHISRSFPS